jgi:hypothetical protein
MALTSGTHLGPWEIISAIVACEMVEVYRTSDSKLRRDVVDVNVLPQAFARDALSRDHSRRLSSLRQQSQPLFVIQGLRRDQFLGKHIHFSREGGKVVATAEDCLPPSGAKPDEVTHTTLVGKRYPLSLVTTRSKPSLFRLGFV